MNELHNHTRILLFMYTHNAQRGLESKERDSASLEATFLPIIADWGHKTQHHTCAALFPHFVDVGRFPRMTYVESTIYFQQEQPNNSLLHLSLLGKLTLDAPVRPTMTIFA